MDSLFVRMLAPDAASLEVITRDDEAPLLAMLPVLAGVLSVMALMVIAGRLIDTSVKIVFSLLLGPPAALFHSWWLANCLRAVQKLRRGGTTRSAFICVAGWSWLPVIYLSVISLPLSQLFDGKVSMLLLACAFCWQIILAVVAMRRLGHFGLTEAVSFCLLLLPLSVLPPAALLTTLWMILKGVV